MQTWTAVHARLQAADDADPCIELRHNTSVQSVGQDAHSAWAATTNHEVFRGDVVIGADGHRSVVRRSVSPEKPDATFAGYVLCIGLTDESAIPSRPRWPRDIDILRSGDKYLFGYPLPGPDGSAVPGSRQIGWGWFDTSRNELLCDTGRVAGHVPTPMTGSGFSASLDDAEAIAGCVAAGAGGSALAKALRGYEKDRLSSVRDMVLSGQRWLP